MKNSFFQQKRLLTLALNIAIILSLSFPRAVIADDTNPPSTEESPIEEPALPEEIVMEEAESAEESKVSVPEILEELPAETTIIVQVDNEIEPLVTQVAETALLVGDPIWCPEGVAPIPGTMGCTASYASLFGLIDDIDSGNIPEPSSNGVIWILAGNDISSSDIEIDAATFLGWGNYSLTIQGGWDGTSSGNIIGNSVFSVPLAILNWQQTVTINNISINGTNSTGLTVDTVDSDIFLNNVTSNNNLGINSSGAELLVTTVVTGGNISIADSTFSANGSTGLSVNTNGDINLQNVVGNNNGTYGVELYSQNNITISGINSFNNNSSSGVYVESAGDISINDLSASDNDVAGSELYAGGNIVILGTNVFNNNQTTGLYIEVNGDFQSENLTASGNDGSGVELYSTGEVDILGTNIFSNNNNTGIYIESTGNMNASNISAEFNGTSGLGNGAEFDFQGNIIISGTNVFNSNQATGIYAESDGLIDVTNLTANENIGHGAELNAGGNLSLAGTNVFSSNGISGLIVDSNGQVNAENITASLNNLDGASLTSLTDFVLIGTNLFENNNNIGLYIESGGTLQASNISSSYNGNNGAELYAVVSLELLGTNIFNNNSVNGIVLVSENDVYAENMDVANNGADGLFLDVSGNASISCGTLGGNVGYEIAADMNGTLVLSGVDFGSNPNNVSAGDANLVLVSNNCFTYPNVVQSGGGRPSGYPPSPMTISYKDNVDRNIINLDCQSYRGTVLTLENGDGAYIPCPIIDSARLANLPPEALGQNLPQDSGYISAFILDIYTKGQLIGLGDETGIIDFSTLNTASQNPSFSYTYWNGLEWIEVTDQSFPFMNLFFVVPEEYLNTPLAILYWDGSNWLELTDDLQINNGRSVGQGGHFDSAYRFSATVNFTGTFVLVKK